MVDLNGFDFTFSNKMLFPSFAPDVEFKSKKKDIIGVIKINKCLLLRYISDFDNPNYSSFWYIIKDKFIPIEDFSKNTRNQVKKGLKNCEVKKVSLDFFRSNCYEIYSSSILSYGQTPISKTEFKNASYNKEMRDFWIVFCRETNTPIAYSSNKITDNSVNYTYIKYNTDYQNLYPSYALHYEMDKYYLEEKKVKFVNVGARSLLHETGIQDFLINKFKYRKAFCKLNIVYSPLFGVVVNMMFPFRGLINKISSQKLSSVKAVLKQHEISKN